VKLFVGLGNPGEQYRDTRHNVGFRVMDALARAWNIRILTRRCRSLVGEGMVEGREVVLAKPQTYMNNSGRAAASLLEAYGTGAAELLVVCDDFHLDLARLRARRGGSSGGQKGLQSIIDSLGTEEFARLRIGIGPPKGDPVEFVLKPFRKTEEGEVEEAVTRAAEACEIWLRGGIDECMSAFN
jgi:PTH1 family peptidyl-tRNA hydrolase